MLFNELKKHIRSRELYPAYIVTGEDAFLVSSSLKFFRTLADPMPDFNLCEIASPDSVTPIIEACESLPLASEYRVVIVSQCKIDLGAMLSYLENPCPSTVLVFVAEKPGNNYAKIVSRLTVVDCAKLDGDTALRWIVAKCTECSTEITRSAASLLIEYCGGDMSRISAETEKLCAYRSGGTVRDEDIATQVAPTLDFKIFALSDAVAMRQPQKAALVLRSLLDGGSAPISLLGLLYAHFRRLLYVAITPPYERMTADLGVKSEYVIRKSKEQARAFTPKKLKKICDGLQAADYDVKSGKITDKTALELTFLQALAI